MKEECFIQPIAVKPVSADQLQQADYATLSIRGMNCENCVTRVRNSLLSIVGVYEVNVYLNIALAEVTYNRMKVLPIELVHAVACAGNDGRHSYLAHLVVAE